MRDVATRVSANCHWLRKKLGVLPSPLWGGVGGGGRSLWTQLAQQQRPPSPPLPHKGGGSRPSAWFRRTLFGALLPLLPATAAAQPYPARTVSVIVPFPAGGSVDGVARILVQKLNETVGQHFIVENRPGGASGNVGANAVAKAAPDGYTLLVSASVHVINPFLYKSVPYDVVRDFTPVSLLADGPLIVSTTTSVPANNLKDFFALVRKDPQKFTFGATTTGSASHLAIELLKLDASLDTLVVAYKGTAPALTDLMSGQIQLLADPMLSSLPLAQGGKIKALGITSLKRAAARPDI